MMEKEGRGRGRDDEEGGEEGREGGMMEREGRERRGETGGRPEGRGGKEFEVEALWVDGPLLPYTLLQCLASFSTTRGLGHNGLPHQTRGQPSH